MIHNHEVPSSILGRATRKENPLLRKAKGGFCFQPAQACLKPGENNKPRMATPLRGSPFLGCVADLFRITERREVILKRSESKLRNVRDIMCQSSGIITSCRREQFCSEISGLNDNYFGLIMNNIFVSNVNVIEY